MLSRPPAILPALHPRLVLALCGAGLAACGAEPGALAPELELQSSVSRLPMEATGASGVQAWDGSAALQANKQAVAAAARKLGANDDMVATLLAMGMLETNDMDPAQRDTSKDGAGLAKNYSAFNMNGDMLSRLGWSEASGPDLNSPANIEAVVGMLLKGITTFSLEGFLCFHRGGATALADRCSYDAQEYVSNIKAVANYLKQNPQDMTSARRLARFLRHV